MFHFLVNISKPSAVFLTSEHFHHVSTLHLLLPRALLDGDEDKG